MSQVGATLVGKDRALEIIVNILLPIALVWAEESQSTVLQNAVHRLYGSCPKSQENRITRTDSIANLYGSAALKSNLIIRTESAGRHLSLQELLQQPTLRSLPNHQWGRHGRRNIRFNQSGDCSIAGRRDDNMSFLDFRGRL